MRERDFTISRSTKKGTVPKKGDSPLFISRSPGETVEYGRKLGRALKPGTVVALVGDLASGKTTLVKGIALGLGVHNAREVKSPTFVILRIYPVREKFSNGVDKGGVPLYHFDLYRLDEQSDLEGIGLDEYLFAPDAVSVIEWAERIPEVLKRSDLKIELKVLGETKRTIQLRWQ